MMHSSLMKLTRHRFCQCRSSDSGLQPTLDQLLADMSNSFGSGESCNASAQPLKCSPPATCTESLRLHCLPCPGKPAGVAKKFARWIAPAVPSLVYQAVSDHGLRQVAQPGGAGGWQQRGRCTVECGRRRGRPSRSQHSPGPRGPRGPQPPSARPLVGLCMSARPMAASTPRSLHLHGCTSWRAAWSPYCGRPSGGRPGCCCSCSCIRGRRTFPDSAPRWVARTFWPMPGEQSVLLLHEEQQRMFGAVTHACSSHVYCKSWLDAAMLATCFAAENLMQVALREHRSQTGDGRADDQVEEDMLAVAIRLSLAEAAAPSVDSDCMLTTWPRSSQQPPQPAWVISRAAQPFHVLIRHTNMSHMAMRRWQSILLPHLIGGGSLPAPLNRRHSRIRATTCTKVLGRHMQRWRCCPSRQTPTLPGNQTVMHSQLLCCATSVCAEVIRFHSCEV